MVKVGIVLEKLSQLDLKKFDRVIDIVVDCLPNKDNDSANDEIVLLLNEKIRNSEFLELILGDLYGKFRDILTRNNKFLTHVNVFFNKDDKNEYDDILDSQIIYIPRIELKPLFSHTKEVRIFDLPLIELPELSNKPISPDMNKYQISAIGGTFDHLHDGHKILLSVAAFLTTQRLVVGVTDQELLKNKKFKEVLQSYEFRCKYVTEFLRKIKPSLKVEIYPLRDVCGPTLKFEEIQCLLISKETLKGSKIVNDARVAKGMSELEIYIVDVLGGDEHNNWQEKLSSTSIRQKLIELREK
ncbi:hypothetical protein TBLA_0C07030 [Henningerozyma blattae CBS 6284]|uniref:Cytidyltransferase-like domain-containing protein n=1 Tax=Henningerozyma blattae (strain ATCC 34711 / CBS 6284 / DSM 70876 / NBRC 10599 / NRRL Y-10934 / UCD 77-7) TaxID=1071380 RepID=I2H292_HENB6|nr:hypothetical protein TBLA_0C07030 [Tetrapisispora blattae CBS 6284]CCH60494.1 hypothetical protein TBLA_0C07030 [Tetrapisispora blattae CBS 6284]